MLLMPLLSRLLTLLVILTMPLFLARLSLIPIKSLSICFFFFQAEDGIRDYKVIGVQTCALPISAVRTFSRTIRRVHSVLRLRRGRLARSSRPAYLGGTFASTGARRASIGRPYLIAMTGSKMAEIGRGAGRERGEISGVAGSLKKK